MTVNNKISMSCKTVLLKGQQFIDLLLAIKLLTDWFNMLTIKLLTDGLIFIGSISQVILTSQCRGVVQILGPDGQGY